MEIDTVYFDEPGAVDFPIVHIPKSTTMAKRCYKWSEFDNITSEKLKKVSTIAFEVRANDAKGENVMFNVAAIGKYSAQWACSLEASSEPFVLPKSSASVAPEESSSACLVALSLVAVGCLMINVSLEKSTSFGLDLMVVFALIPSRVMIRKHRVIGMVSKTIAVSENRK